MRISGSLLKQHIGWHFKKFWVQQGARKVENTGVEKILSERGISVHRSEEILKEKREFQRVEVVGFMPRPTLLDETHPNWHSRPLLSYRDDNVLLEGLTQAKILTKTVEIKQGLPDQIALKSTNEIDSRVKEIILSSHVFDAEQKKLPKIKDPKRPAWNFPRIYGITQERASKLLLTNLLQLIESWSDYSVVEGRHLAENSLFCYNFEKYKELIQFELRGEILLTSRKPLAPMTAEKGEGHELPNIAPIKPTITLSINNIYETQNIYPISLQLPKAHPHTVFAFHIETEVKNLFDEEVTENQIFGRTLLKAFTAAATYAKAKYGENVTKLPEPITIQCVHTNGRLFHFGILQLNTLDQTSDTGIKNIWYQTPRIPLFDICCYKDGRPTLEGYNNQVIQYLDAFYNNQ